MKESARIFVGPSPEGVTGQSVAFAAATRLAGPRDVVLYWSAWGDGAGRKLLRLLRAGLRYLRIIAVRRVSVLYITTSRSRLGLLRDACFILLASMKRVRVVNHLHGSDFKAFRQAVSWPWRALIDFVYRRVDCSIVLHEAMAEQYADYPGMVIRSVANFVSADLLCMVPASPAKAVREDIQLLYLSNVIKDKGIVETIRAVDSLVERGLQVRLNIVGESTGRSALQLTQEALGPSYKFGSHISDCGPLYGRDKAEALCEADVFVLPSYYASEAFPLSAVEAMAFGCVLVLSSFRYLPAIFGSFGARFVVPGSWEALRDELEIIVTDNALRGRLGSLNWRTSREQFGERRYLERLGSVLSEFDHHGNAVGRRSDAAT